MAGQIGGSGKLYISTYLILSNATLDVRGTVNMVVSNRMRFSGTQAINLYDDAQLSAKVSFDAPGDLFSITLNNNSKYLNLAAPSAGAANIAVGSKYVLNDNSSMNSSTLTATAVNDAWLVYNTKIYLNDAAAITFKTDVANTANIASYISAGKILINNLPNAVSGANYTYEASTGVLQAVSKTSTLSLVIIH